MTAEIYEDRMGVAWEYSTRLHTAGLVHGFTERRGGAGTGLYDSLNLSFAVGDAVRTVLENRRRLCAALGCDILALTTARQNGESHIAVVSGPERGAGAGSFSGALLRVKALLTDLVQTPLLLCAADSVPLVLYDRKRHACAVAVCDLAACADGLAGRVVAAMDFVYGTRPEQLYACIGPAATAPYVTVGARTAEALLGAATTGQAGFLFAADDGIHVDAKALAVRQLEAAGVASENIDVSPSCTVREEARFFSLRRDGNFSGRNGIFALLT